MEPKRNIKYKGAGNGGHPALRRMAVCSPPKRCFVCTQVGNIQGQTIPDRFHSIKSFITDLFDYVSNKKPTKLSLHSSTIHTYRMYVFK